MIGVVTIFIKDLLDQYPQKRKLNRKLKDLITAVKELILYVMRNPSFIEQRMEGVTTLKCHHGVSLRQRIVEYYRANKVLESAPTEILVLTTCLMPGMLVCH